jgi:type IV pilus assembly protein PilY1
MANAGGTNTVYSATSASQLQSALNNIVANILGKAVVSSYASPPSVTVGSLEFLLKNVNPVSGQGDLYAYPVTSTGAVSSTEAWTANQYMSTANRTSSLYTTPVGQTAVATLSSVASTTSSAFAISTKGLTASTIANYTINPSYNSGQYLGGRQSGWYVGLPSSAPAEVLTPPNNANLIANGGSYVNFVNNHSARQNAVLFSDNDGFLYALGYANTGNPTLLWGWMPGALLPALQQYNTFWQGSNMGNFGTIDASPDNGKTWHTYVIGTASLGSIIYDLQLSGTSAPNLQSVVKQVSNAGYSQPQASAPVFYQVQNPSASNYGTTWALFALNQASTGTTGSSASSALGILNVTTGAFALDTLPFANTATPYIDQYGNLFLGDSSGNVYEMSSSNLLSLLTAGSSTPIPAGSVPRIGNYAPWASSSLSANVQYIGGSFYQGYNYLRVQGPSGITVYQQTNGTWAPLWTAYSGGAGSWSGGTYTSLGASSSTISALPGGSSITDQALINEGSVIVPVTIPPSSNNTCGVSTAAYYIYKLNSGAFPAGVFTSPTGAALTQGYVVGQGSAFTPAVTVFNGKTLLQGAANQNTLGGTSGFASALGSGSLGGPIAWRIIVTLH